MAWREQLQIGELTVEQPLVLKSFIIADLPPAADWLHGIVTVPDATPPCIAFSDGTDWLTSDDGTAVA
jgi:hypothetical protein